MKWNSLSCLLFVVGCGGAHAWRPAAGFDAVSVSDDLVVRGDADGAITVLATVRLDSDTGMGSVRLLRSTVEVAARSPHLALARARGWQVLALRATSPERALEAVRRGVAEIQACCHTDSLMYLRAAEAQFADAGTRDAALERARRALRDLISTYVTKNHVEAL